VAITKKTRLRILERDDCTCRACEAKLDPAFLEIDHIIPVSWGGADYEFNLQVLCRMCNSAKSDNEDVGERRQFEIDHAYCKPLPPLYAEITIELD